MFRAYKKKLIIITIILSLLVMVLFVLPDYSRVVHWYNDYIFVPFQSFRNMVFSIFPFSIGDLLYILGALSLVFIIGKWIYYLAKITTHKHRLLLSFIQTLIVVGVLYIVFLLGWGGNYYKASLSSHWDLEQPEVEDYKALMGFENFLIEKINATAIDYEDKDFAHIDKQASIYYKKFTNRKKYPTKAKPSLFGNSMQYLRIQGYYNPFTGEAQVNKNLPAFMLPFVICHEMAHQQGIAAEDDANLLAYAVATLADDASFRYSAYFNIWLYTHRKLKAYSEAVAEQMKSKLNNKTLAHIEVLKKMRELYASDFSEYSGAIYDEYLKMHRQNDGIGSYNKVWMTAAALEKKRRLSDDWEVLIP